MAFDITSVLKGAAAKTEKEQIIYLPIDIIDPDPENFYELSNVQELASSIAQVGLLDPIRVRPGQKGRYIVVSGHRRRAAILNIMHGEDEARHQFDDGVPCIIDDAACSPAMQRFRLISANAYTRVLTPGEQVRQFDEIEGLIRSLKEEDVTFNGRIRDQVAKVCNVNPTKIGTLRAIRNKLVPELWEEFSSGRLNESVAYRISAEPEAVQKELARRAGDSIRGYTKIEAEKAIAQIKAPKPAAPATQEEPKFDGHGHLEWDAEEYLEQRRNEDDEYFEMLSEIADRFLRELDAVNTRQEGIKRLKTRFGKNHVSFSTKSGSAHASPKGLLLEKWERGKSASRVVARIMRTWTDAYDLLCTIALNRVSGWEGGKVSDSDTAPKWKTGRPPVSGLYAVKSGIPKEEGPQWTARRVIVWTGDAWVTNGPGVPVNENIYGWVKLPEEG